MRVLQINAVYNVGSTGVIVSDLHELSMKEGIESHVAYSTSPLLPNDIHNGYRIGNIIGKKTHALLCRINGKQAYFSRVSTKRFLKYVDKIKPDIVHLHNLHSNYINLNMVLDYLGKHNIKTVITLHDCWYFTGGCFNYTADNCSKWTSGCGKCPKKLTDTPALLFDKSSKIISDREKYFRQIPSLTVVGVSKWTASEAQKTFLNDKNVTYIYNGIDTDFFVNTPSDLKEKYGVADKFVILGAANKWMKDVNRETLDYFSKNLPDDTVLMLIGCTEKQRKALPNNVIALDYFHNRRELRKVYSMADVFANCTREDALSLINIEAQSCGTPVVTYRNSGVMETVDNECGFSVENGNPQALFDAVMQIKKEGKEGFSAKTRAWVVDKFNRDENYKKYIELYSELANCEVEK